ncbi:SIR2 family protein [Paenibacillus alvei]|uniref:SIR2 family protein n=1 Tax=Paenibacillus alvei TaxID=44250 RepID=UPI0003863EAA|nr:SIR2 family protein [Paenibacillus alvei]EPY11276.1 hypothetical protein PAAL66ix_18974 [Paenibacillus alvei A6-6i-x]
MLFDTLINTELEIYQAEKKFEIINRLYAIPDLLDNSSFKITDILSLGYSEDESKKIVDVFKYEQLIEEKISIECYHKDETDEISNVMEKCPICNNTIDEENHEMEPIFIGISAGEELRGKIIENICVHFINKDYIYNFNSLKERICNNKVVPFIGAGMSKPLGAPGWTELFLLFSETISSEGRSTYESLVDKGKYFDAINILYNFSNTFKSDDRLRERAAAIIEEKINYYSPHDLHNYHDLLTLNFPYYLTTNYDNAINHCQKKFSTPLEIEEIENIQSFLESNKSQVVHLHGIIDKPSTMVLTKGDYIKKYNDNLIYQQKLSALMSAKSLLFLGFSFYDQYFDKLYNFIHKSIGGNHFLVTHRITEEQNEKLIKQNITPILIEASSESELVFVLKYFFKNLKY